MAICKEKNYFFQILQNLFLYCVLLSFKMLVLQLCVGSPMRQRRGQQIPPSPSVPSPAARAVASALTRLLTMGLSWEPPAACPVPKFRFQ